uniref:Arrestin C-terminal-like domain-containing protein n=1 Tax=Trichogramma kaykai TaxID=54128 RepID=A0ABD2XPY7_9HYME
MQVIRMGIRIIQGANNVPRNVVYGKASKLLPGATTTTTPATGTTSRSPLQYFRTRSKENNESSNVSDDHDDEIKLDDADDDDEDAEPPIPQAEVEKQFLLSDGRVKLEASLDRAVYAHGEPITVRVNVTNNSGRSVKRIMTTEKKRTNNRARVGFRMMQRVPSISHVHTNTRTPEIIAIPHYRYKVYIALCVVVYEEEEEAMYREVRGWCESFREVQAYNGSLDAFLDDVARKLSVVRVNTNNS